MNYYMKIKIQEQEEGLFIHHMEIFKHLYSCLLEHKLLLNQ